MTSCVFCQRIAHVEYVRCDRGVVRFEPLNPVTEGHMLFIHRIHSTSASSAPWITGLVMEEAARYARSLYVPFNLITSAGLPATQSIFHMHVHYVPRHSGDGLHLPWTGQGGTTEQEQQQ